MADDPRELSTGQAPAELSAGVSPDAMTVGAIDGPTMLDPTDVGDRLTAAIREPQPRIGSYLSREQVQQLHDELTMGDTWQAIADARKEYPDDADLARRDSGMRALYYVAKRIGMTEGTSNLADWLTQIRQDDFVAVLNEAKREEK